MSIIGSNILAGASGNQGGYNINNSLRFRSSASAYLKRTPSASSNQQTWTWSGWVKRGALGSTQRIFASDNSGVNQAALGFNSSDKLFFLSYVSALQIDLVTTQVFRDPSAWYHIVVAIDTTQATAANRTKMYVNGTQITAFTTATYSAQNYNGVVNGNFPYYLGTYFNAGAGEFLDGYMAEVNFIDGQALTPTSFGSTSTTTGSWIPKKYTGTYGTNGFYLNFSDIATTSSSNAGLGKDFSGNANYWTTNNISVDNSSSTAGTTYDAMIDSPTLTSATVANYCVLNPLDKNSSITLSNGNLTATGGSNVTTRATYFVSSGKWYWETTVTSASAGSIVGIVDATASLASYVGSSSLGYGYASTAFKYNNATLVSYGATFTTSDVVGIALDLDAGTIEFYKNNVSQGVAYSSLSGLFSPAYSTGTSTTLAFNFGQRPFSYTPPSGFVRLNTFNLPDSTIKKGNTVMDATLYTGTGASLSVTNTSAFKPDFVWVKGRSGATDHALYDSVRGTTKDLVSNSTAAETTQAQGLTAFDTGGFTVGTLAKMNTSAATYVGWQWQAGQGSTSSNTSGTITSTVSVNTTAGFSVVTYTGTGANATIGHGLGVAPSWVIVKRRDTTSDWQVRHTSIAAASSIQLNSTAAAASATTVWNSTAPSSTVFSIGTAATVNASAGTYVAYCWAEIAGFSKFGSYTGNGSADGPFVYTGFRPKFVMVRNTSIAANWLMFDTSRDTYNVTDKFVFANSSGAETSGGDVQLDLTSNGFKVRQTSTNINGVGNTLIYMAFAENPLKFSNAR